jgi:hypothetical protein
MKVNLRKILSAECWLGKRFDVVIIHKTARQLFEKENPTILDFPLYYKLSNLRKPPILMKRPDLFKINTLHGLYCIKQYVRLYKYKEPVEVVRFDKIQKITLDNYPIVVGKEYRLANGSHRLGSAIASGIKEIDIRQNSGKMKAGHGFNKKWIEERFNEEEINEIMEEWKLLKNKFNVKENRNG